MEASTRKEHMPSELKEVYDDEVMHIAIGRLALKMGPQHPKVNRLRDIRMAILGAIEKVPSPAHEAVVELALAARAILAQGTAPNMVRLERAIDSVMAETVNLRHKDARDPDPRGDVVKAALLLVNAFDDHEIPAAMLTYMTGLNDSLTALRKAEERAMKLADLRPRVAGGDHACTCADVSGNECAAHPKAHDQ